MGRGSVASKRQLLEQLLEQGMVLVALDARKPGVNVPVALRGDPQLRLNLSYRFGLPLVVDDDGVRATLTFNGMHYACDLPWSCIFLIVSHVSGQPVMFPDDIPMELLSQPSGENRDGSLPSVSGSALPAVATPADSGSAGRPRLSLVAKSRAEGDGADGGDNTVAELLRSADGVPAVQDDASTARDVADDVDAQLLEEGSPTANAGHDEGETTPPKRPTPVGGRRKPSRGHLRLVK